MIRDKSIDVRIHYVLLEVDDDCKVTVRPEGDETAVFITDEYEDFEVALAFSPERFQKFVRRLQEF
jgi:hypothetical protein